MADGIKRIDGTYRGKPTHHYEIDGKRAGGVTTLISDGLPKPFLVGWGIKSVAEYATEHLDKLIVMRDGDPAVEGDEGMGPNAVIAALKQSPYTQRDTAAANGTEVHNLAELMVQGVPVEIPDHIRGHVEACARFLDDWKSSPVLVEAVVASRKWMYAGTLDLIADLPDGRRVLFDYKTGKSIYGEAALQLAAYRYAEVYLDEHGTEQPMADLGITDCAAVHITSAGYSVHPLTADEATFRLFTHIAHVARNAKAVRDLVGPPVTPMEVPA